MCVCAHARVCVCVCECVRRGGDGGGSYISHLTILVLTDQCIHLCLRSPNSCHFVPRFTDFSSLALTPVCVFVLIAAKITAGSIHHTVYRQNIICCQYTTWSLYYLINKCLIIICLRALYRILYCRQCNAVLHCCSWWIKPVHGCRVIGALEQGDLCFGTGWLVLWVRVVGAASGLAG